MILEAIYADETHTISTEITSSIFELTPLNTEWFVNVDVQIA